jgi:cell wall-associated NlpC family hydrolase
MLFGVVALGIVLPASAANAEPTPAQLAQQIEGASIQLEKVVEQYNLVTEQLKATQVAVAELTGKMTPLQTDLAAASTNVTQFAVNAYKGGPITTMTVLLNSGSSDALLDTLVSLDQISRSQQRTLAGFNDLKGRYDTKKAELDALLAQQTKQQTDLAGTRTRIEADLVKLNDLKKQLQARPPPPPPAPPRAGGGGGANPVPPYVAGRAGIAVKYAYGALGKPYKWAADGPDSYDCSGLTMAAWRAAGLSLPHNAAMQWRRIPHISRAALRPGDLVFYYNLGHVAIYVGNNQVIHAPTFGDHVKISSVDMARPYGYGRPA